MDGARSPDQDVILANAARAGAAGPLHHQRNSDCRVVTVGQAPRDLPAVIADHNDKRIVPLSRRQCGQNFSTVGVELLHLAVVIEDVLPHSGMVRQVGGNPNASWIEADLALPAHDPRERAGRGCQTRNRMALASERP